MKDMARDYDHHAPQNDADIEAHTKVREAVRACAAKLEDLCPGSRELSVAHTHLETAMFWANASLARKRYDTIHGCPQE